MRRPFTCTECRLGADGERDLDRGSAIPHLPALDGVRGIAILLVLCLHFGVAADLPNRVGGQVSRWVERVCYVGWSGVDLFFVLSGFLITSILLATKSDPQYYRRFYGRRILRIFPLYYVTLALALLVVPYAFATALPPSLRGNDGQIWFWTYTVNLAIVFGWGVNAEMVGHFWTLAIEEQYYLLWPWIVRHLSRQTLLRTCVIVIVAALALRIAWIAAGLGWEGAYRFTFTRVDAFGVGGLVALLAREARMRRWLEGAAPLGFALSTAALVVLFLQVPRFYPSEPLVVTAGHSLLAIAFGWLVVLAIRTASPRWLQAAPLRALGKYSYGIYVWHWPLQRLLLLSYATTTATTRAGAALESAGFILVGLAGSMLLGWVSYHLIEAPFLRLKKIFAYSTRSAVAPARPLQN